MGWKQKPLWHFCVVAFSDGKSDSTPDQTGGHAFPENALNRRICKIASSCVGTAIVGCRAPQPVTESAPDALFDPSHNDVNHRSARLPMPGFRPLHAPPRPYSGHGIDISLSNLKRSASIRKMAREMLKRWPENAPTDAAGMVMRDGRSRSRSACQGIGHEL